jgi:hypothetical protein
MKRTRSLLGMFMIAAILLAHSGCAMLVGHVALAAGKKVYHKIEDDKAKNERAEQSDHCEMRAGRPDAVSKILANALDWAVRRCIVRAISLGGALKFEQPAMDG